MHFSSIFGAAAAASLVAAGPINKRAASAGVAVYWGQNGTAQQDLSKYCTSDSGIDTLILGFMSNFTESYFWGPIGKSCEIHSGETSAGCTALGQEITTCQAAGKKVLLSIGGFAGQQSLSTSDNAKSIANNIWGAFANPADTDGATTVRPFGDAYVNGFDFDYEQGDTNTMANLPTLISQLRANIGSKTTYLITGAPECGIPSPFMDSAVLHAQFDILWPQFYNCAGAAWYYTHGTAAQKSNFNYDAWVQYVAKGASKDAQLYLGLPGGPYGATTGADGPNQWLPPNELATLVNAFKGTGNFGGVMMYDAAQSDAAKTGAYTYAQEAKCVLDTGKVC